MRSHLVFTSTLLMIVQTSQVYAQVDPSSALLLNSDAETVQVETPVDAGRYTIRPRPTPAARRDEVKPVTKKTTPVESAEEAKQTGAPQAQLPADVVAPVPVAVEEVGSNSYSGKVARLLELSIAPGYLYNNSDSSYFYRRYSSAAPTVSAEGRVWVQNGLALQASYLGTLSGQINDSTDGSKLIPATQQWLVAGIRSRKLFGSGPILIFGLDYSEYQLRVTSDADLRAKLKSSGVLLSVESEIPVSDSRAWTLGFSISPKLAHKEESNATDFSSGGNVEANAVSVSVGGRIRFAKTDSVFWKLSHSIEKDLFSGEASVADPVSGVTPTGVGVTNAFTLLQFGYTWSR